MSIEITIEPSHPSQQYIEDCSVCCRPINLNIYADGSGDIIIEARNDNDE